MTVMNKMDRFHLVMDALERLPQLGEDGQRLHEEMQKKLIEHKNYIFEHGVDMPEITDWTWDL